MKLTYLPLKLKNLNNKQIYFIKKDKIYINKKNKLIKWYSINYYSINKIFYIINQFFKHNNINLTHSEKYIYNKFVLFCYKNSN